MAEQDVKDLVEQVNARGKDATNSNGFLKRLKRKLMNYVVWPTITAVTTVVGTNAYLYSQNPDNYIDFAKHKGGAWLEENAPFLYDEEVYEYPVVALEDATLNAMPVPKYVDKRMVFAVDSTEIEYDMLRVMAAQESSFKATVKNEFSRACGLMQLIPSTQLELMYKYGEEYGYERLSQHIENKAGRKVIENKKLRETVLNICTDAFFSLEMGAEYARENIAKLHSYFPGRYVTYADVYMYHFFGANGGRKFITNLESTPGREVRDDYPANVIKANKPTFFKDGGKGEARTYAEMFEYYASKISTQVIAPDKERYENHYTWSAFLDRAFPST